MPAAAELSPQVGSAVPSSSGEISASSLMGSTPSAPVTESQKPAAAAVPKQAASVSPPVSGETGAPKVIDDGKKPSEKLFENLRKKAEGNEADAIKASGENKSDEINPEKPPVKPADAIDKKKVNPWKVIDEHKAARARLEAEVADLKKIVSNPETRKQEVERLTAVEKRNQELEEMIKFVDYSKSKEFNEKYQAPYEKAWSRAMSELKELTVVDEGGDERAMAPSDLLELVNLPLLKAREKAEELYGAAANEVMAYRKEIRGLYDQQTQALEQARKSGVEKSTQEQAQRSEKMNAIREETNKHWEGFNKAILDDTTTGAYFKPVEGNEELNGRLEAGYKFVDETMAMNPMNPELTPEQRVAAVKRHASLRHRAAAFGRMRMELEASRKESAEIKAKLAQFEKSVPNFGGDTKSGNAQMPSGKGMSGLMQRLQAKAV
jgi:hypothetical protein